MSPTDATSATTVGTAAPAVDLASEAGLGVIDALIIGAVVAVALLFLWRTYFRRRRPACAGCGKAKACPAATNNAGAVTPE